METELDCTIDLAILRGTFDGWNVNIEFDNFQETDLGPTVGNNIFYQMLIESFPDQFSRMLNYGRRNVSWNTVAPTGTVNKFAA